MSAYKIFKKTFSSKNIKKVFEEDIRNKPSIGIDGIQISVFEKKLDTELKTIKRKVLNGTYEFSFYKQKLISKGRDKYPRVISIPTIRDKIVLKLIFNFLKELYSTELSNDLVHTTIHNVINSLQTDNYTGFVKIDVENFYPSINHEILLKQVKKKTRTKKLLSLLEKAITQETLNKPLAGMARNTNTIGVPQGLSISNILASIYLLDFDTKYKAQQTYDYYRYVDDVLIICNENDIEPIFDDLKTSFQHLTLTVHPLERGSQKSDYGTLSSNFYFLGYQYTSKHITVREASINNLYNSIIHIFTQYKYSQTKNIDLLYWKLNLKITGCKVDNKKFGWLFFFSQINDLELLFKIDLFIQKLFHKFSIEFDKTKVKKFIRTYYEIIKNRSNTNYIPNFDNYDTVLKRQVLEDIFNLRNIRSEHEVDYKFSKIIYKSIKEMEQDIQRY